MSYLNTYVSYFAFKVLVGYCIFQILLNMLDTGRFSIFFLVPRPEEP